MSITADQHVHSHHSGDSEAPMEDIAERAISCGLEELCFTEHMDIDYPDVGDPMMTAETFILDADEYYREFKEVRDRYSDRIKLHFGVEIGLQPHIADENREFIRSYPFELVIASIHVSRRRDPYYPAFYEGRTEEAAFREVMEETLENIRRFDDFDVIGHLDYMIRYMPSGRQDMDESGSFDVIDEILRLIISRDQGLDLNTSQLWKKGYPEMNPSRQILERFVRFGGGLVTFGSDAHKADNIAGAFDRAEILARECGLTGYSVFRERKPQFRPF